MSRTIDVQIWSDISCPWCYIGKRRFERAVHEFAEAPGAPPISWTFRSFQLHPFLRIGEEESQRDFLTRQLGRSSGEIDRMLERVIEIGRDEGISFAMEAVRVTNTGRAHEFLHLAGETGTGPQAAEALWRRYFSEGGGVGRIEELAEVGSEIGLDGDDVRSALDSGRYRSSVRSDQEMAATYGIRGVPFFLIDERLALSGAQASEIFLDALRDVAAEQEGEGEDLANRSGAGREASP